MCQNCTATLTRVQHIFWCIFRRKYIKVSVKSFHYIISKTYRVSWFIVELRFWVLCVHRCSPSQWGSPITNWLLWSCELKESVRRNWDQRELLLMVTHYRHQVLSRLQSLIDPALPHRRGHVNCVTAGQRLRAQCWRAEMLGVVTPHQSPSRPLMPLMPHSGGETASHKMKLNIWLIFSLSLAFLKKTRRCSHWQTDKF